MFTITADGWIPKEQARGPEALVGIPLEFQGIDKNVLLPPTLSIVIDKLLESDDVAVQGVLRDLYKGFAKHYDWYLQFAQNAPKPCTFSWK